MAVKMSREERAKQFMPFAALKGYQEALRKKEEELAEQMEREEKVEVGYEEIYERYEEKMCMACNCRNASFYNFHRLREQEV